jgi:hypothetical protein
MANKQTEYSIQYLENLSADLSVSPPILRRALVGRTATGSYVSIDAKYHFNDLEEVGDTIYVGMEASEDDWLVVEVDESSGVAARYATINNNSTITTYSDAWSGRATLTYERYVQAF